MTKKKTNKKYFKRKKKNNNNRFLKTLIKACILALIGSGFYLFYCYKTLPDVYENVNNIRQPSITVTYESGKEIKTFGGNFSDVVYAEKVPFYVKEAIIAIEDKRFYEHFGFDPISFTRAMLINLISLKYKQGASTITQQVAKNLFLNRQKNLKRKVQELMLALWLEKTFDKDQILTLYLNRVYFGNGAYGIEAASQKYFKKTTADLTLLEGAVLAGILKSPNKYNPIANQDLAFKRASVVLDKMQEQHYIAKETNQHAKKQHLLYRFDKKQNNALYFADWILQEVPFFIGERAEDVIVYTTLNEKLQIAAEEILKTEIESNKDKNVTQGAVIVLDLNGAVKAMVGGTDYFQSQFNRATQALRQAGSAFKPFVYLTALERGFTKTSLVDDVPVSIGKWTPKNYDKKTHGKVSLQEALASSLNLATVNLSSQIPTSEIIKTAKKLGISSFLHNSPSLCLGTANVKVLDMASAYSVFANGGLMTWPHAIKEVFNKDGIQVYMRHNSEPIRIVEAKHTEEMSEMLEAVIVKGTGYKAQTPFFVAGKTGTSQDYRDAWMIGFSDRYVVAVWLGNDDNTPMKNITGGSLPAEIWKKIMLKAHEI